MIVPGGGLTFDGKWKSSRKKFFIPIKVIAKRFRGKFLSYLQNATLTLDGSLDNLKDARQFHALIQALYNKDWYVYCKRPFKTTSSVLSYLGRYTHRVAISNHRIIGCKNGQAAFKYRDYKDGSKQKVMTLTACEFINRFLLHILPPQFTKICHYGLLASSVKGKQLTLCKKLLGMTCLRMSKEKPDTAQLIKLLTGVDVSMCPVCGATLTRASPNDLTA